MLTFTEYALNIAVWTLLGIGCFFGVRAALRRRRERREQDKDT